VILLSTVSWAARPPGLDVDAELGRWEAQATALLDGPTGCWEFTGSVHLAASGYVPASRWTRPDRHDHHLRGPFTARFEGGQWRSFEYTLTPDEPSESDEDFEIPVWPLLGRSPEGGIGGGEPPPGEGGSITVGSEGVAVKAQGKAAVNTLRRVLDEIDPATATAYAQWDERLDGVKVFQDFPLQEGRGSDVITFAMQILRDVMAPRGTSRRRSSPSSRRALGVPRGHVEGVVGFYASSRRAARALPRPVQRQHHRRAGRQRRTAAAHARRVPPRARRGQPRRPGVDRHTSCTGLCDQGPALLVNDRAIARLTPARIGAICSLIRGGVPVDQWPDNLFVIHSHVERTRSLLDADARRARPSPRPSPAAPAPPSPRSSARACAGAAAPASPTGPSGRRARRRPGPTRYVVCNADEGEPGTFKDRELL
jgi:(2Fe-2S) ferredoxin